MRHTLLVAAALAGATLATLGSSAQAAPLGLLAAPAAENQSLAQKVDYGYCRRWAHECRERWGFRPWAFRRCMRNHGC